MATLDCVGTFNRPSCAESPAGPAGTLVFDRSDNTGFDPVDVAGEDAIFLFVWRAGFFGVSIVNAAIGFGKLFLGPVGHVVVSQGIRTFFHVMCLDDIFISFKLSHPAREFIDRSIRLVEVGRKLHKLIQKYGVFHFYI